MFKVTAAYLLVIILAINSHGDVLFEMSQKDTGAGTASKSEGKVKGENIRLDMYENGDKAQGSMVFRGDRDEMIMINHQDKSYVVLDEAAMRELGKQMDQAMSQMEEALKDVPPEKREMVRKMMKERMPGLEGVEDEEPVMKKAGKGEANGYPCTMYDVFKGDVKVRRHCVAPWAKIKGGEEMKKAMLGMADFMDMMAESFSHRSGFAGRQVQFERNVFDQLRKLDGFPVETIDYSGGQVVGESGLMSSKKQNIDPSEFETPQGYKPQSMNMK